MTARAITNVENALTAARDALAELQAAIGRMAHPQSSWARLARDAERHVADAARALARLRSLS